MMVCIPLRIGCVRERLRSRQECSAVRARLLRRFVWSGDVAARARCTAGGVVASVECRYAADDAARQRRAAGAS